MWLVTRVRLLVNLCIMGSGVGPFLPQAGEGTSPSNSKVDHGHRNVFYWWIFLIFASATDRTVGAKG